MKPAVDPPLLAFDATEWFHDPDWAAHVTRRHWRRLPARADAAIGAALAACERHGARATWFVGEAVARRWPALLRRLVDAGHEVASSGHEPVDLDAVPTAESAAIAAGWARARTAIEAATGRRVRGFRAPWPARGPGWWHESLRAAGYDYEVDADGWVRRLDGRGDPAAGARVELVTAWELDVDQPRLRGLPRRSRRAHEARLVGAAARLEARLRGRACQPIGPRLGLGTDDLRGATSSHGGGSDHWTPPAGHPGGRSTPVISAGLRLAVVVPLKDEAEGVPSLLAELDALRGEFAPVAALEFVFVDDGSTDATAAQLAAAIATRPDARLLRHERNRGVAAAIRTGILATDAPLVASIDADLSYDPRELRAMLPLAATADVVTASPYHPRGGVRNVPRWRLLLSCALSACYRRLLRRDVRTWTSCFRVYRRAAVVDLPQQHPGFLGTAELLVRLLRRGGTVAEHPCVLEARLFGVSKLRVLRTVRDHLGLLWQVARGKVS